MPLILRHIPSDEIPFRKTYHKSTQNLMNTWWFQIFVDFHPYLRKWSNLTSMFFRMGWFNHQLYSYIFSANLKVFIFHWYWVRGSIPRYIQLEQIRGLSIASTETFAKFGRSSFALIRGYMCWYKQTYIYMPLTKYGVLTYSQSLLIHRLATWHTKYVSD